MAAGALVSQLHSGGAPGAEGQGMHAFQPQQSSRAEQQKMPGQDLTSVVKKIAALDKMELWSFRAVPDAVCDTIQDEIAPYEWEARGISATAGL